MWVTLIEAERRRTGCDTSAESGVAIQARADGGANTIESVAKRWIALKKPTWSVVHALEVERSLERDIYPAIGGLPITALDSARLFEVLSAVALRGAVDTARRLCRRLSDLFDFAISADLAQGNPTVCLLKKLPKVPRARTFPSVIDGVRNHGTQITAVRQMLIDFEAERTRATTKFAFRLQCLTAVRPNEIHGARWDELEDLDGETPSWRIPAARMKGDQHRKAETFGDHLVPLSTHALEVIRALRPLTGDNELMFPSERHIHRPICENTLRAVLVRAGYYQRHVPHGIRAAFSTIMGERPDRNDDDGAVVDLMLALAPRNKPGGTYDRASHMPRRRELAQAWADLIVGDLWGPEVQLGRPMRWAATGPGPEGNR